MMRRYATEKEIINALSDYKKGDVITLLEDKIIARGLIKAGTKLGIREVKLKYETRIFIDELDLYEKNNDSFFYLVFCSEREDGFLHSYDFTLSSDEFVKGELSVEEVQNILDARKKKQKTQNIKNISLACGIFLLFWALVSYNMFLYNKSCGIYSNVAEAIGFSFVASIVLTLIPLTAYLREQEKEPMFKKHE